MAVTEKEKLKLNVNNIKSALLDGRKNQNKIDKTKKRLVFKGVQKQKRLQAEASVEKKPESKGSKSKMILGGLGKSVTSIWDKVLNFFGIIVIGALVKKLPDLIEGIEKTFEKIKGVWDTIMGAFTAIGESLKKLVNVFTPIFGKDTSREFKDAQKELDNLDKEISEEDANTLLDIDAQKESLENEGIFPGDSEWDHLDAKENAIFDKYSGGGESTAAPSNQPMNIAKRKLGGGIEKSEQPNQQPARSPESTTEDSPLKLLPKVAKESTKPIKVYSENIEKLSDILGHTRGTVTNKREKAKIEAEALYWVNKERKEFLGLPPLKKIGYAPGVELTKQMGKEYFTGVNRSVSPVANKTGDMKLSNDSETTVITYIQPIETTKTVRTSTSSGSSPGLPELQSTKTEYIPIP